MFNSRLAAEQHAVARFVRSVLQSVALRGIDTDDTDHINNQEVVVARRFNGSRTVPVYPTEPVHPGAAVDNSFDLSEVNEFVNKISFNSRVSVAPMSRCTMCNEPSVLSQCRSCASTATTMGTETGSPRGAARVFNSRTATSTCPGCYLDKRLEAATTALHSAIQGRDASTFPAQFDAHNTMVRALTRDLANYHAQAGDAHMSQYETEGQMAEDKAQAHYEAMDRLNEHAHSDQPFPARQGSNQNPLKQGETRGAQNKNQVQVPLPIKSTRKNPFKTGLRRAGRFLKVAVDPVPNARGLAAEQVGLERATRREPVLEPRPTRYNSGEGVAPSAPVERRTKKISWDETNTPYQRQYALNRGLKKRYEARIARSGQEASPEAERWFGSGDSGEGIDERALGRTLADPGLLGIRWAVRTPEGVKGVKAKKMRQEALANNSGWNANNEYVTTERLLKEPTFRIKTTHIDPEHGEDRMFGDSGVPKSSSPQHQGETGNFVDSPLRTLMTHHFASNRMYHETMEGLLDHPDLQPVNGKIQWTPKARGVVAGAVDDLRRRNYEMWHGKGSATATGQRVGPSYISKQFSDFADRLDTMVPHPEDAGKAEELTRALRHTSVGTDARSTLDRLSSPLSHVYDMSLHHETQLSGDHALKDVIGSSVGFTRPPVSPLSDDVAHFQQALDARVAKRQTGKPVTDIEELAEKAAPRGISKGITPAAPPRSFNSEQAPNEFPGLVRKIWERAYPEQTIRGVGDLLRAKPAPEATPATAPDTKPLYFTRPHTFHAPEEGIKPGERPNRYYVPNAPKPEESAPVSERTFKAPAPIRPSDVKVGPSPKIPYERIPVPKVVDTEPEEGSAVNKKFDVSGDKAGGGHHVVTRDILEDLAKEHQSRSDNRTSIAKRIESARLLGDLSENGDYHAAKDEQGKNEMRIRELEGVLSNYKVIRHNPDTSKVDLGHHVRLQFEGDEGKPEEYFMGSPIGAKVGVNTVSPASELGKRIVGKGIGETVEYPSPSGTQRAKILGIR